MTLFDIAKRNLKTNSKQYLLYFYPMVFSIVIYFTFVSLQYNEQIQASATTLGKIEPAFLMSSILLFIFAAIFIWYSNAYFTRKRKKEVALYSLFGMKKKQIAQLLFYENLILGMIALAIGIVIGTLLSKLFVMLLMKLMGFTLITSFTLSSKAVIQTIIAFMTIIMITSVYNYMLIYRHSLLQLFKAEKQGEKIPKSTSIMAIFSLLLLGTGYTLILQPSDSDIWSELGGLVFLGALLSMIVGTYFFLNSFILFTLKRLSNIKSVYLKGVNLVSISHLLFRIKGNVRILTVIALLSTFTLFATGTTFSLYYNLNNITDSNFPFSIIYTVQDEKKEKEIKNLINNSSQHDVKLSIKIPYLKGTGDLTSTSRYPSDYPVIVISETSFMEMGHHTPLDLGSNGALAFNDGNLDQNKDPYTNKDIQILNEKVKIISYEKYSLVNHSIFHFPIVISDALYQKLSTQLESKELQLYNITNEKQAKELTSKIQLTLYDSVRDPDFIQDNIFSSYYDQYQKGLETYGILIFISGFLGCIFLLATGSMLYYKQLTEAVQDQQRYQILQKIGMNQKQIRLSIAKQLVLVFLLPLLVAISHSTVIIQAISNFIQINMALPFAITIGLYIVMYFVYYLLTLSKYHSLVNK
ncbi:ABC transporter permease [Bacillus sp. 31A1R]|uniref:ABC transporter permease n=1 Tax=Robertmurraya mangrovi TaxID=3098077 RepID=A0ABU5IY74_9BACI|nr:ABC transporter permease [Bacillus sp. 31A1R]MDZ5472042.1 ABC transporter permease [Bacillus sp. 31A1R]